MRKRLQVVFEYDLETDDYPLATEGEAKDFFEFDVEQAPLDELLGEPESVRWR